MGVLYVEMPFKRLPILQFNTIYFVSGYNSDYNNFGSEIFSSVIIGTNFCSISEVKIRWL